ncbi:DUF2463 domain-containing protein [Encephalitozoon hellem]|uniref:DUF2463 domain-containing protein n=2 Tax=Encephalitozoon hellem TaxID=27973 RepID=A0ABY8CN82_ENCHE|nr:DUF2463 domain-containing protein [Encephalitozoon hellem]WEL39568.1 DUF2463 domain-containing protein [Encephalitozoon hellem]
MNVNINVPVLHPADKHIKEHRAELNWKDIIQICAAPISMVFPIITYLLLDEDTVRYNILLKLAIVLPPFLYSGVHCLIMFNKNRTEQSDSSSTPLSTFLSIIFLLFSLISLLSIIALSIVDERNEDLDAFLFSMIPFLLTSTYLLSTSYTLTRSSFQYTTTNTINILLDLLIFLSITAPIADIALNINVSAEVFCFIILPATLIFIRSWREKYLQSAKYNGPPKLWRIFIPAIILVTAIIAYGLMGFVSLFILSKEFPSLLKNK